MYTPIATSFWRFQKRSRFNTIRGLALTHIDFYGRVVVLVRLCIYTSFNYKPKLEGIEADQTRDDYAYWH